MSEFNPSPEFEEKIRRALAAPEASPEFISRLEKELARRPVKMKSRFVLKPAWAIAFALAAIVMVVSAPRLAAALKQLFGYVPEVGLVENTGNLRMLAKPVSVTRDGVTLTISSVFVYADRTELIYDVQGVSAENDGSQASDGLSNPKSFCGGLEPGDAPTKEGNAVLRLPDGTVLERDATSRYPQNVFAMQPVYAASIPADVTRLTLVLDCIPWARRGAVPEQWEMPFDLVAVPEGAVVGAPVIDVTATPVLPVSQPTAESVQSPAPVVTMKLERVIPLDTATVFYFSMDMENRDPSLISIMPLSVYVVDSQGRKIHLIGNYAWQPFEHRVSSAFQFTSQSKPAVGPLTLVVENAVAYYAPMYVEPRQATPDEMSFTFDAGADPQYNQTWPLDAQFTIAGYQLKVTSVRAANFDDIKTPDFIDGSQGYEYGYDFAVEGLDPSVKLHVEMDIMSESPMCGLTNASSVTPEGSSFHYIQLCRDGYPTGQVRVTIRELSVLVENVWQTTWMP